MDWFTNPKIACIELEKRLNEQQRLIDELQLQLGRQQTTITKLCSFNEAIVRKMEVHREKITVLERSLDNIPVAAAESGVEKSDVSDTGKLSIC